MRLLFFGDLHDGQRKPISRLDDFQATKEKKITEIVELGNEYEIDAFLQPGDFWDKPKEQSFFLLKQLMLWAGMSYEKESFLKAAKKFKPMYGVVGNHEMIGNAMTHHETTSAGIVENLGFMEYATKEKPIFLTAKDGTSIAITGTNYHMNIDKPEHLDDYIVTEKLADIHIHIVHGFLTDKPKGDIFAHTLVKEIAHTKADLTISGHDHIGFEPIEIDGKWFFNSGAITRLTNDKKEMARTVKVMLIDISKEGVKLKAIPLKSALPSEVILSREKVEEKKKKGKQLEEFRQKVRVASENDRVDILSIINESDENEVVTKKIKETALTRIREHKALATNEDDEKIVDDYYIEKVIMKNFESHKNSSIHLSKGLNVLIGESGHGKSSVLRAIKWVVENNPTGKSMIRIGERKTSVTLVLSTGYEITRFTGEKNHDKNGYIITSPNGESEIYNTKVLPTIQALLGYQGLKIDVDIKQTLNFSEQGESWFLISRQFSAPLKAKIIGSLYGTQYADAAVRTIDNELLGITTKNNKIIKEKERLDEAIKEFNDLPKLEEILQKAKEIMSSIKSLEEQKLMIEKQFSYHGEVINKLRVEDTIVKKLEHIDVALIHLERLKVNTIKLEDLVKLTKEVSVKKDAVSSLTKQLSLIPNTSDLNNSLKMISRFKEGLTISEAITTQYTKHKKLVEINNKNNKVLDALQYADKALLLAQELKEAVVSHETLREKIREYESLMKKFKILNRSVNATENIAKAASVYQEILENIKLKEKLLMNYEKQVDLVKNKDEAISLFEKYDVELEVAMETYKELLLKMNTCPTCHSQIDEKLATKITKTALV